MEEIKNKNSKIIGPKLELFIQERANQSEQTLYFPKGNIILKEISEYIISDLVKNDFAEVRYT
jgi:threonyl-tRNA synthetase